MREDLSEKIIQSAPNLFKDSYSYMAVDDGWYDLLLRLSQDLEALNEDITIIDIKEKFGGLRFYVASATSKAHQLIDDAEEESYKICERCGAPGSPRGQSWTKTVCDIHFKDY